MKAKVDRELSGITVEAFHPDDRIFEFVGGSKAAFEGSGDDASAKGLGEEQAVARARAGLGQKLVVLDYTKRDEAKFGFFILDGMPSSDHHACFEGLFSRTANDGLGTLEGQGGREGGDVQREEGLAPHRVDVGKSIGSSDCAIIVGVVHNRGEKIDSGDERLVVVETPNSSIVGGIKPDDEIRVGCTLKSIFDWQQNLRQRFRVDFGRSARAG